MDAQEARQYLESFINYEIARDKLPQTGFKLNRIQNLLSRLNNPQQSLKVIHVAGSKGKGSTCIFTAHILKEAGYKVGLYTSPHLCHYTERIRILQRNNLTSSTGIFSDAISEKMLSQTLTEIKPAVETIHRQKELGALSYFEILTVLALYYFKKENVDFVILETGLGGRWDATNVVNSLVCAITPISLEHTEILGNTLDKIASEKVAIIKENTQKVVVAYQEDAAHNVINDYCKKLKIIPRFVQNKITPKSSKITSSLLGRHQQMNAATAIEIIESLKELGYDVPSESIATGLKTTFWPGRFEIRKGQPKIILDCAHNEAAAKVLVETFKDNFPNQKVTLVLGLSEDKNRQTICQRLNTITERIIVTKANHPRAAEISETELKNLFPERQCYLSKNIPKALELALTHTPKTGIILVTGSVFIVGESRNSLRNCPKKTWTIV